MLFIFLHFSRFWFLTLPNWISSSHSLHTYMSIGKDKNQTAESSSIDPKACNPSYSSKGRTSSDFFLCLWGGPLSNVLFVPLLSFHYLHLYDFHCNGTATALSLQFKLLEVDWTNKNKRGHYVDNHEQWKRNVYKNL